MRERDYAFEALAEVTNADPAVARGPLNASLKAIREQSPEIEDSYLLGAEIHDRAQMYRRVFEGAALTPTALAKHWSRLPAEAKNLKRGGSNLHSPVAQKPLPARSSQNLEEARKILAKLKGEA